jgi:hypothetical protein
MRKITTAELLIVCIGTLRAVDLESYEFIDHLQNLTGPRAPEIYEDAVIFTASSSYRRVGIAFAHEGFSRVHWLQKLLIPKDSAEIAANVKNRNFDPYMDSGILFHIEVIPEGLRNMDYRMIIDGLWTVDPLNPNTAAGSGGLFHSRVSLPLQPRPHFTPDSPPGQLLFHFRAPPGEIITVAGSFNNWDPFMYEMRETSEGFYTLALPLPPGIYQYIFFYRGERYLDPYNAARVFSREGKSVSQAQVR